MSKIDMSKGFVCPACSKDGIYWDARAKVLLCHYTNCNYVIRIPKDSYGDVPTYEQAVSAITHDKLNGKVIGVDLAKEGGDETVVACYCRAKGGGKMYEALTQIAKINPDRITIIEAPEPNKQIADIKEVRNNLRTAKNMKCSCSGFVIQYQGCGCEKNKLVKVYEDAFWKIIDAL